jgi:hypothetical protein
MSADDLWEEVLNPMMKRHLGWGEEISGTDLVQKGHLGLAGILNFMEYFVLKRGISASLFKGKLAHLMDRVDKMYVTIILLHEIELSCHSLEGAGIKPTSEPNDIVPPCANPSTPTAPSTDFNPATLGIDPSMPIDVDAMADSTVVARPNQVIKLQHRCSGYIFNLPAGQSPLSTYPFALHDSMNLPWDYAVTNGMLTLHAHACEGAVEGMVCNICQNLQLNSILEGIK